MKEVSIAGHFGVSVCPLNMYSKLVTVECCQSSEHDCIAS